MPTIIQTDDAGGLIPAFGIRGGLQLQLDEMVAPVAITTDLSRSPYVSNPRACGQGNTVAAAGAGRYSGVGVQVQESNIMLLVKQITITNPIAGARTFQIRHVTAAQVAACNLSAAAQLRRYHGFYDQRVGSRRVDLDHAAIVGARIRYLTVDQNRSVTLNFDRGFACRGDDGNGYTGIVVWNPTANEAVDADFECEEWRLR